MGQSEVIFLQFFSGHLEIWHIRDVDHFHFPFRNLHSWWSWYSVQARRQCGCNLCPCSKVTDVIPQILKNNVVKSELHRKINTYPYTLASRNLILWYSLSLGVNTDKYMAFARQQVWSYSGQNQLKRSTRCIARITILQVHYILGSTGRSFVVGYGVNPPTHCHHRGASCYGPNRLACFCSRTVFDFFNLCFLTRYF